MLDSSDLKIIHFLLSNSRMPLSEMAKAMKISQPAVQKRIQRLKSVGVITGSTVILNQSKIGWKRALVVANADKKNYQKIVDTVQKLPMVTSVYQTTGPYAIAIEIVGPAGVVNGVISHMKNISGIRDFCPISFVERVL